MNSESDSYSQEKANEVLQKVTTSVSGYISYDYFEALVISLFESLNLDIVFIGAIEGVNNDFIRSEVVCINGKIVDNLTYALADTPCEDAINQARCIHQEGVQAAYPKDKLLEILDAEGYIAAPLLSSTGKPIGILAALNTTPIKNPAFLTSCFDLVVGRTASEMERMHTEQNRLKFHQIVDQSPLSVVITDTAGHIEYVNKYFEASTGFSQNEVLGKSPSVLKSGETSSRDYKKLWEHISSGGTWTGEFHNKRKDGSLYWEKANIGPLKNARNEITGYIAIKEDISQLKLSDQKLRLASAVFETTSEAVMVTNKENEIQTVNSAFSQITGYTSEEVIGENPSMLQSGRHAPKFYDAIFDSLAETGIWTGEIWNRRKNGEAYPEWLSISTMRNESGDIEGYAALFSDITKKKQDEARIQHQANYDSLTGLANRRLFSDRFSHALREAKKQKHKVGLFFLDLDRLKCINDTLGHSIGDQLLQLVSSRLKEKLPTTNTVARLGGDEFAIIMTANNLHSIEDAASEILEFLSAPYCLNGKQTYAPVSIGVSVYPSDGDDTETLLRKADSSMYIAKTEGGDRFHFFTVEMDAEAQERQSLELALRQALSNNEFCLHFQPIMDSQNGTIDSAEALIRWNCPGKGLISPDKYIPLAEETGLIVSIGEWVLYESCKEAAAWSKVTKTPPAISVNLSSVQIQRQDVLALVKTVLARTGLPAKRLTLELTESLLVSDDAQTLNKLQGLHELGVKLSIDDFGTGYSSLSYLKKFPVSTLKIDRSFIKYLPEDVEDAALVNAILSMAECLSLKVIAEGVETEEQREYLMSSACRYIQGYFYSKPLPRDRFILFLKANQK